MRTSPVKKFFYGLLIFSVTIIAGCAARPNIFIPAVEPIPPAIAKPRVALALGGGGARGIAHVGVLKVLREERIPVDLIVGTSAGSIVGALYASNPNPYRVENILLQAGITDLLDISPSLVGPISGNALQNFILTHATARTFRQLRIPFIAVATDLLTGQTVPIDSGPLAPAVNASAAMPPVFHPVTLYGRVLVDGGVVDNVPVDIAKKYNPDIVIAVSITPNTPRLMPTSIIGAYNRAYILSDARFAEYNMEDADVKIHPYVGQTGVFQSSNKADLIRAGERAARRALPQICALLREKNIPSRCS